MSRQNLFKRLFVGAPIAIVALSLVGCASEGFRPDALADASYGESVQDLKAITGSPTWYQLDYLSGGSTYRYESHTANGTAKIYGFLFKNDRLVAVQQLTRPHYSSGLGDCAAFPPNLAVDTGKCLANFTTRFIKGALTLSAHRAVTPDAKLLAREHDEAMGAVAETAMLSPLLIVPAIVSLPVLGLENASASATRKSSRIRLGESYAEIQKYVEALPAKARIIRNGDGVAYVPSGIFGMPAAAFGIQDGKVIWITMEPNATCGEGFMFFGMRCWFGTHRNKDGTLVDDPYNQKRQ